MVREYGGSAGTLTWGVALLVLGVVGFFGAQLTGLRQTVEQTEMTDGPLTVAVLAGLTALVGLGTTLLGVWQAATNIDIAARGALDAAAEAERAEAVRREEVARAGRDALDEFRARARAAEQHDPSATD